MVSVKSIFLYILKLLYINDVKNFSIYKYIEKRSNPLPIRYRKENRKKVIK